MRGAAWVLAIAVVGGGTVAWLVHTRGDTVDRQLDAELAAALDRGGIADLGRAQAIGRRLVLGTGGGRSEAAALAFADARLAIDYGVPTAPEAEEILARFGLPDGRSDGPSTMAAGARALLIARNGDREGAARVAATAAAAEPGLPYPLYALGRARALGGDLEGAARAFDAASVVAPAFLASRAARAEVLLDLGNVGKARLLLASGSSDSPGDPRAQLLMDEVEVATRDHQASSPGAAICAGPWRPPAIETACLLARAERERRAGNRAEARADGESAARAVPDEPRLLARTALLLAQLGAVDQAAALLARAHRRAAAEMPMFVWATAAVALGRGHAGTLPAGPRPADPETTLLIARTALAAGGVGGLGAALGGLGPTARDLDGDLERFGRLVAHTPRLTSKVPGHPPREAAADDPMQAYLDGLAAQLAGDLVEATERFGHALSGHGDACRAAGEYVAALRAQKRRPDPTAFAPLRAENSRCVNLR
ncbi:MAG TPA: tetratricopeptide repeat protein [Polyangia bacterium]|nr:tetratricopeptide repeat protein [Polyangia bacterium]